MTLTPADLLGIIALAALFVTVLIFSGIMMGAWLMHRKQAYKSPVPDTLQKLVTIFESTRNSDGTVKKTKPKDENMRARV